MVLRLKARKSRSLPGLAGLPQPTEYREPNNAQPNNAGWSSPVARQAHNLKVEGSNPSPATKKASLYKGLHLEARSQLASGFSVSGRGPKNPLSTSDHISSSTAALGAEDYVGGAGVLGSTADHCRASANRRTTSASSVCRKSR